MGVDSNVMNACDGLHFKKDYTQLYQWSMIDHMILTYKHCKERNGTDLVIECNINNHDIVNPNNYRNLRITIYEDRIDIWAQDHHIWEGSINDFDGESVENIDWLILANQNNRMEGSNVIN